MSTQKWVLRSNELTQDKETSDIYELNSHQRHFSLKMDEVNQAIRTEDVMKITLICLFINVCKVVLCIASRKFERLISQ